MRKWKAVLRRARRGLSYDARHAALPRPGPRGARLLAATRARLAEGGGRADAGAQRRAVDERCAGGPGLAPAAQLRPDELQRAARHRSREATASTGSIAITGVIDQPVVGALAPRSRPRDPARERDQGAGGDRVDRDPARRGSSRAARGRAARRRRVDAARRLQRQARSVNTIGAFKQVVAGNAYVFSQFEAIYARRVFPCFDEPDNKVPWKLTLDVPQKLVAVSNTPIATEVPLAGDRKRVEFAQTPPLPLVPDRVRRRSVRDRRRRQDQGRDAGPDRHARRARRRCRVRGEDDREARRAHRGVVRHPVPVRQARHAHDPDHARVRRDGERRADHVHRDADAARRSPRRERAARVDLRRRARDRAPVVRRLVTMAYWDDLWLNEGFATWLEHKIAARFDPSWHDEQSRARDARLGALDADGLVSARQIRQPIRRAGRHPQRVRRHHLRQGRQRPRHVRGLRRARRVPARRARLPEGARVRQRDLGRLRRARSAPRRARTSIRRSRRSSTSRARRRSRRR